MSDVGDENLQRIVKGTGISFIGSLVNLFFGFVGERILIARLGTESEFGVFSLAFAILNISALVATLGLQHGSARNIAYARGKKDKESIQKVITFSIQFGLVASVLICIALYYTSNFIANQIFHDTSLIFPLKLIAFGVPFAVLLNIMNSVFRGFDNVKPGAFFAKIFRILIFFSFVIAIIIWNLAFNIVFYALITSFVVSGIGFLIYAIKKLSSPFKSLYKLRVNSVGKELLIFSLPLLGVIVLEQIIAWTDTFMLGFFKTSADVGLYNVANPLSRFILAPLLMVSTIYIPIASKLYSQDSIYEINRNFSVLTKWLCSATLPLFLIFFLFPEPVLNFLFGANYIPAANVLRILSLGFMLEILTGPNKETLIAVGKTQFIMWATLTAVTVNIMLNAALIPPLNIIGAAIASVISIVSINLIRLWKVHSITKVHFWEKNLIKPMFASLLLLIPFYFIFTKFINVSWWMLPLLFIFYYFIYVLTVLLTKSFEQEDINMLLAIEKRAGLNVTLAKKVIKKFR